MRILTFALLALVSCIAAENPSLRGRSDESILDHLGPGDEIPGAYIVQFKDDIDESEVFERSRAMANTVGLAPSHVFSKSIKGFSIQGLGVGLMKKFEEAGEVLRVEPDRVVSIDAPKPGKGKNGGGGGGCEQQETPPGITRVGGPIPYMGNSVAWVIDTGIQLDHPDLNVDVSRGFSAFTKGKDSGMDDGNGHGTHVAGTIAARIDDGCGVGKSSVSFPVTEP